MGRKMDVINYTPLAIWMHILTFLPATSLIVLRSVCKFFLTVIDDPYFVSLHIHNFPSNFHETRFLTLRNFQSYCELSDTTCEVLEIDSNSPNSESLPSSQIKWIESSSSFGKTQWNVAGSINGLLLVISKFTITLWNPSINKSREIPYPSNSVHDLDRIRFGLGYDSSRNDYKAIAFIPEGIRVYSVNKFSWSNKAVVPTCRDEYKEMSESLSFKSGLVWIESVDTGHSYYHRLVRFDFAKEDFEYIVMPYPMKFNLWVKSRLVLFDGGASLGVTGLDSDRIVSIWVLDGSSTTSWTKMYNVGEGVFQMSGFRFEDLMWEFWTKDAKRKVSLYEGENKIFDVPRWEVPPIRYAGVYFESLVLV